MKSFNSNARMTGSGSAIFSVFSCKKEAYHVLSLCPKSWVCFVARGTVRSLLNTDE
jgi:4-diphosphocytidyl-2C-methyl-D-erythritol kinase